MKLNDLSAKCAEYAMTRLVPSASSWTTKFAIGCFIPDIPGHVERLASMSGSVGEDGTVDIARLKTVVMSGFKSAGHLDLLGGSIGFDPSDADKLFAFLEGV